MCLERGEAMRVAVRRPEMIVVPTDLRAEVLWKMRFPVPLRNTWEMWWGEPR